MLKPNMSLTKVMNQYCLIWRPNGLLTCSAQSSIQPLPSVSARLIVHGLSYGHLPKLQNTCFPVLNKKVSVIFYFNLFGARVLSAYTDCIARSNDLIYNK